MKVEFNFNSELGKKVGIDAGSKILKVMAFDIQREAISNITEQVYTRETYLSHITSGGKKIYKTARQWTYKLTGRLRASISVAGMGLSHAAGAAITPDGTPNASELVREPAKDYTINIGTNVKYAKAVEYGNPHFPQARPFMVPAYKQVINWFRSGKYGIEGTVGEK